MKSSSIRPVLLRVYVDNDCHATSAVLFNDKIVISPAHPILNEILTRKSDSELDSILRCLEQDQPFTFFDDPASQYKDLKCVIVPPEGKTELPVNLRMIFNCKPIRSTFDRLLLLGSSQSIRLTKDDELTRDQRSTLLSSFFAFELEKSSVPTKFSKEYSESHSTLRDGDFTALATPYGNAIMQGSAFKCRVANVVNGFLYLLDIPLSKFCEGGLLLNPSHEPLGMILTTTFDCQNENINLTFAVDLNVVLQGLTRTVSKDHSNFISLATDSASKFVVLIESGAQSFGTGVLIRVGKRRLILTCSHVVAHKDENYCTWNGKRFPIKLIYQNPTFDRPFDVAVFEAPNQIPSNAFCRSAKSNPILGSTVKAIGFPIFEPRVVRDLNIQPSIYRGKLVNYRAGMIISDTMIQSGQSGGPLFDEKDQLVGILVSNFRENDTGRVFPALNCSVPLFNIISYLTEYSNTNDVKCLKKLEGNTYLQRLWNFEEAVVHSKL